MTSPPSFDTFFHSQQQQHPSHQSSQDSVQSGGSLDYPAASYGSEQFGAIYAQQLGDEPLVSDPQSMLQHQGMEMMLPEQQHQAHGHGHGPPRHPSDPRSSVERKDSVPFDPSSSSTLIASASNDGSRPFDTTGSIHYHQDYGHQFSGNYQPPQGQSYDYEYQQQHSQADYGTSVIGHGGHGSSTDLYGQAAHGSSTDLYGQAAPQNTWAAHDYLAQQDVEEGESRRASWHDGQHLSSAPGAFEEQLNELQRIISNASSHGTHGELSRVASPFQASVISGHTRQDSTSSVNHSPSPYTTPSMAAPSPPISGMHRGSTTSLQGSPYTKPQSPPALIIPGNNGSQSPSFQPMAAPAPPPRPTVDTAHGTTTSTSQFGNSLLPPVNPALEHLTGMAGISPIAPNVDGPMITIQPSTPISGLKDGGGHFDAALRRANAQWQGQHQQIQQQQQQQQQSTQPQQASNGTIPASSYAAPSAPHQNAWSQNIDFSGLEVGGNPRPRAKSESYTVDGGAFERQAAMQLMQGPLAGYSMNQAMQAGQSSQSSQQSDVQWSDINAWRMAQAGGDPSQLTSTLDPRTLPGNEPGMHLHQQVDDIQSQQRARLSQLNTEGASSETFNYEPGQFSPTSMAFYQQLGVQPPASQSYQPGLIPPASSSNVRRRSFAEGTHHAVGAGTPGYGVEFTMPGAMATGRAVRGAGMGHRRAVKSEDFGRPGQLTGWGVGQGGSTADFLNAITNPDDGTLLPPAMRGRSLSHSRHSSASSQRSASPALSVSSQGSSFSHHSHMDMPDGVSPEMFGTDRMKVAKMKVTSMATEVASQSRRTNSGIFHCPIPGCNSTFTRHFNLKGHLRSHNDERPYKCEYEGCPKAITGFARQHDCKRHMLLHEGQRPFECEGCGKRFARLDALTRHHKSDQGQQCAISHPLPVNPDGSAMSESQYKAYRLQKVRDKKAGGSAGVSADERE